ncbi:MAG: ABC transporter ATP-binding protein [Candidatus Deferrimicrobiaceae bacterium]|jgi:ABC-2 type transport system ATP-binding protein|nr:ABC transporter ATP-binding protein [Desulfobacterales bacterium]
MHNNSIIKVEEVSKLYKNAEIFSLKDLTLHIEEQEIFGLLGPNGAGKTTLISILCGIIDPTFGTVKVGGFDIKNNRRDIQQIIGIVPQEYALYPDLSARENLNYFGHLYGLKGLELKERIADNLELLGLTHCADRRVSTYSSGMKRRVNLIAGIINQPRILFLDEPTVGVDVQSRHAIIELLVKFNRQGSTIIYTSHHMAEAESFCSRVAIIDKGKLIIEGEPQGLISSGSSYGNLENIFLNLTGRSLRD